MSNSPHRSIARLCCRHWPTSYFRETRQSTLEVVQITNSLHLQQLASALDCRAYCCCI